MRVAGIKIKPRVVEPRKKLTVSLKESLVEQMDRYAEYLGGATDRAYVMEQVLEQFLVHDRDFQRWLDGRRGAARRASRASAGQGADSALGETPEPVGT
jgi:hypothetical protein